MKRLSRRAVLVGASVPLVVRGAPSPEEFEVEEKSLSELRAALDSKRVTSVQLVTAYLARIARLDASGPTLKSVLELNPDALRIAGERDAEKSRGALHGIPVLIKDNLDTADQLHTTAGSLALLDAPTPKRDSSVVAQLRAAGAVILGKTNLSEWANLRGRASTSGWSARGGLTKNPYVLTRNASGSSSGSAVAVAASLCGAAIGTETDGSIVSPASVCGVVGFKPTMGLVSRRGIIPLSHSQDIAGPIGRSVKDVALMLEAMSDVDVADAVTVKRPRFDRGFVKALGSVSLKGRRFGVVRGIVEANWHVAPVARDALKALEGAGATLVDVELSSRGYDAAELEMMLYELKSDMDAYLTERGGPMRSLNDLVEFNAAHAKDELSYFGQQFFEDALMHTPLISAGYTAALKTCQAVRVDVMKMMSEKKVDALVAPTGSPAWLTDFVNGDAFSFAFTTPAAVGGLPHVTVPMGFVGELPVAMSFVGFAWDDAHVLGFGHAFEQLVRARKAPRYFAR